MFKLFGHMPMEEAPMIPLTNSNPMPPDRASAEDHEAVPSPGRNLPEPQALAHAIASVDDILAGAMHPKVDNKFTHERNEQLQVDGEPPLGNKTPKDGINPFRPRDPTVGPNLSHRNKGMFFKRVAVTDSMFEPSDKGFVDISSDDHVASAGDLSLKQISEKYWAVKKGDEIILWVTKNPHGKWAAHDAHGYPLDKEEFNSVEEVLKHLLDLKQKQPEYDLHDPLVHHAALDDILEEEPHGENVIDENREVTRRNQIDEILNNLEQKQEEGMGLMASAWDDPASVKNVPQLGEQDQWGGTSGSIEEDENFGPDGIHRDPYRNQSSLSKVARFVVEAGIGDDAGGNSGLDGEDVMPLESIDAPQQQQGSLDDILMPERSIEGAPIEEGAGHLPVVNAAAEINSILDPTTQLGPDSEADEFMAHVAHKDRHVPGNFTKKHVKHLVDKIKESPKHEAHEYEADASDFTPDPLGSGDWTRPEGEGEPSQSGEQDMDILADGPQRDLGPNTEISTISVEEDDFGFEDSPSK